MKQKEFFLQIKRRIHSSYESEFDSFKFSSYDEALSFLKDLEQEGMNAPWRIVPIINGFVNGYLNESHWQRVNNFLNKLDYNNPICSESLCYLRTIEKIVQEYNKKNETIAHLGCYFDQGCCYTHSWIVIDDKSYHYNITEEGISKTKIIKSLKVNPNWNLLKLKKELKKFFLDIMEG